MPAEIIAIIDKPWLLAILLAVGAACGIAVERFAESINKAQRRAYWKGRNSAKSKKTVMPSQPRKEESRTDVAAEQLRLVMKASYKSRALLNKPERRLLAVIDKALAIESPGWRAHGQVSLGEILTSENEDAFFAINSKRVDLLIVDADCNPLHAVEFMGTGHHLSAETAARDAVKKEALRRRRYRLCRSCFRRYTGRSAVNGAQARAAPEITVTTYPFGNNKLESPYE